MLPQTQSIQKLLAQVDLVVHVLDMLAQSLKQVALVIDSSGISVRDTCEQPIERQAEELAPQQVQDSDCQQDSGEA